MRSDCTKKSICEQFSYHYCRTSCEKRKKGICTHVMTKAQKKAFKYKEQAELTEEIEKINPIKKEENNILFHIKHKVFDCNNPPPEEELLPEQIFALRMWEKDMGRGEKYEQGN